MVLCSECVLPRKLVDTLYDFNTNDLNSIKNIETTIDDVPVKIDDKVWSAIIVKELD